MELQEKELAIEQKIQELQLVHAHLFLQAGQLNLTSVIITTVT